MIKALQDWNTDNFDRSLKRAIEGLAPGSLPLGGALAQGGLVDDSDVTVTVITASESGQTIRVKIGVFFTELVGGCSCGDDPFAQPVYCELQVCIDKSTARATFSLLPDVDGDS